MKNSARSITAGDLAKGNIPRDAGVSFSPYWWNASPRDTAREVATPTHVDIVVVGSGFTGLSAALTLLRYGRSVAVLDRGVPGYGASTRNGGQLGSGNQKFRVKKLIELRGERKATEMLREGTRMLAYIEDVIRSEGIECFFRVCGRYRAAVLPQHYEAMARDLDDLRRVCGVESFMVPQDEQHSEIGSDLYCGGSVLPNDASIHPALYHSGLLNRVGAAGGTVVGNCEARHITEAGKGFSVRTSGSAILCRNVVVATDGYTNGMVPELGRRVVTIGSGLIATGELSESLLQRLLPKNRVYGNTNRVFSYFRAAPDEKRIIWGGRVGRLALNTNPRAFQHLAKDMLEVFPDLKDAPISHAWDGMIGYTYDEVPHIGRTANGVHYALGYCGTGVSRATYFGNKVALQVLGDPEGRTSFDDLSFPDFPFHSIAQRSVPIVETWYRVRDKTKM